MTKRLRKIGSQYYPTFNTLDPVTRLNWKILSRKCKRFADPSRLYYFAANPDNHSHVKQMMAAADVHPPFPRPV